MAPEEFATSLSSRPLISSHSRDWKGVVLQRYRLSSGSIELPAIRDHAVAVYIGGQTLVDQKDDSARRERRWANSGQMSVIPSGQSISRTLKGNPDVIVMHLDPDLLKQVAEETFDADTSRICLRPRFAIRDETIESLGRLLLAELEDTAAGGTLAADMLTRAVAVHLLRQHSNKSIAGVEPRLPVSAGRLKRVLEFMHAHMGEVLPLSDLAAVAGLSESQFGRAFREATGESPHRYLISIRIQRARELLLQSDLPLIEVALQCGFERPNCFATTFRKATGLCPREWRTMHGHKSPQ